MMPHAAAVIIVWGKMHEYVGDWYADSVLSLAAQYWQSPLCFDEPPLLPAPQQDYTPCSVHYFHRTALLQVDETARDVTIQAKVTLYAATIVHKETVRGL
jgi:hypothetical protein